MTFLAKVELDADRRKERSKVDATSLQHARNYAEFLALSNNFRKANRSENQLILFVDADNLKQINGSLGHATGDALICAITEILMETLPPGSIFLRKGGDEFLGYCDLSNAQDIDDLAAELVLKLNRPCTLGSHNLSVSCSIGAVVDCAQTLDLEDLIEAADVAMTWAKRNGKGKLKFFDHKDCAPIQFERSLTSDFELALSRGSLQVHYQPIFDTFNRRICGAEALIRWEHEGYGKVPADLIISTAAKTGKLRDLGDYVLRKACATALNWPNHLFVSVNFAASDFQHVDFSRKVLETISSIGIDPKRLCFEITELEYLVMSNDVAQNVKTLQAAGIQVGVDDFGTGYSSMGSIDRFPADFIKIDRSLVHNCNMRQSSKIFLRAIFNIAQQENLRLVAEGVETVEELAVVSSVGIELAQGFYFSPALDAVQFDQFLQTKETIRKLSKLDPQHCQRPQAQRLLTKSTLKPQKSV